MANPFIGEIRLGGWTFAPTGWALCNGAVLQITQNTTLFNLIGTTYGGNGQTTFQLPDLRGRVPIHHGTVSGDVFNMGQAGGIESVTLAPLHLPSHAHGVAVNSAAGTTGTPASNYLGAAPASLGNTYSSAQGNVSMGSVVGNNGGSQPHSNIQPYLCITYIISLFGIYPSQG